MMKRHLLVTCLAATHLVTVGLYDCAKDYAARSVNTDPCGGSVGQARLQTRVGKVAGKVAPVESRLPSMVHIGDLGVEARYEPIGGGRG